jgi:hypothetical protein
MELHEIGAEVEYYVLLDGYIHGDEDRLHGSFQRPYLRYNEWRGIDSDAKWVESHILPVANSKGPFSALRVKCLLRATVGLDNACLIFFPLTQNEWARRNVLAELMTGSTC